MSWLAHLARRVPDKLRRDVGQSRRERDMGERRGVYLRRQGRGAHRLPGGDAHALLAPVLPGVRVVGRHDGAEEKKELDQDGRRRRREEGAPVRCSWSPPLHGAAQQESSVLARVFISFNLGFIFLYVPCGVPCWIEVCSNLNWSTV